MTLVEIIKEAYPALTNEDFIRKIILRDDADGVGAYIYKWDYDQPMPDGLTLGKPTA